MRDCKKEGHHLLEVKAVVAYECRDCDYHIRVTSIRGTSFGSCPRCEAPREKLVASFSSSEHIAYRCKNCKHSWRQLR